MPGPVSSSIDPEWGTSENASEISMALTLMYEKLSAILGKKPPIYILDLIQDEDPERDKEITATMTEREWRILRFSLERAKESL